MKNFDNFFQFQHNVINPLNKEYVADHSSAGDMTRRGTLAFHSTLVAARATRTIIQPRAPVITTARHQELARVSREVLFGVDMLHVWFSESLRFFKVEICFVFFT